MVFKIIDNFLLEKYRDVIVILLQENYKLNFEYVESLEEMIYKKIDELKCYIEDGTAVVVGAFDGEKLVGFLWGYERMVLGKKQMHLNQLVVDAPYRKLGIGKELIVFLEKETQKRKIGVIDLMATKENKKAVSFYEKNGFEVQRVLMKKDI